MMVIVTATGLFRCLLNMKQTAFFPFFSPKYVSQYTSEPEVTWENVFLGKLSFLWSVCNSESKSLVLIG